MPLHDRLITVCNRCLMATCWQGIFMCDNAQTAGTTEKRISELETLGLENRCYWQSYNCWEESPEKAD